MLFSQFHRYVFETAAPVVGVVNWPVGMDSLP